MHTYAPTTQQRTGPEDARWAPLLIVAGSVATAMVLINLALVYLVEPRVSRAASAHASTPKMAPAQVAPQQPPPAMQIAQAGAR